MKKSLSSTLSLQLSQKCEKKKRMGPLCSSVYCSLSPYHYNPNGV